MTELGHTLALLCTGGGLIVGLVVVITTREALMALRIALEFWVAAGLLRLSGTASWRELAAAAAIIALRQILSLALQTSSAVTSEEAVADLVRPAWRHPDPRRR